MTTTNMDETAERVTAALAAMHAAQDEAAEHRLARDRAKLDAAAARQRLKVLRRRLAAAQRGKR